MGKITIDIKMQRDASRGRKSKTGGGKKIKSDSRIYTPVKKTNQNGRDLQTRSKMIYVPLPFTPMTFS